MTMTLIEGVGDEVVQFVGVVLVVAIAALAWWSTNARPGRYRTVLVMRSRTHHPVTVRIGTRSNLMLSSTQSGGTTQGPAIETTGTTTMEPIEDSSTSVIPLQEMDSIVDADMAMLDNNRLHFYRRIHSPSNQQGTPESTSDESEVQDETEPASNAQMREMDSIVNAMEADVTSGCDFFTRSTDSNASSTIPTEKKNDNKDNSSSTANVDKSGENVNTDTTETVTESDSIEGDRRKILIKLKYLNDTLKEVEGSLDELLKDFKWRHFSAELAAECRVRLIFNGRVLLDDAMSLRACGLHHRAVVHCLVHPKRAHSTHQRMEEVPTSSRELARERAAPERAWDLENILMTLVSVALTVVWFFRCEYSNMFTASASVALFGLTVFYSLAIFGLYLSDTFQFNGRGAAAIPNN